MCDLYFKILRFKIKMQNLYVLSVQYKLKEGTKKPTFFFMSFLDSGAGNNTSEVLRNLAGTITDCATELKMGHYHQENKFVFSASSKVEELQLEQVVWHDPEVRQHPNVAILRPGGRARSALLLKRYNMYQDALEQRLVRPDFLQVVDNVFSPFKMKVIFAELTKT